MQPDDLNLLDIMLEAGIVVKLVLLLLIAASVYSWAIIFKKKAQFKAVDTHNAEFLEFYKTSSSMGEVMKACPQMKDSPYRSVFMFGFSELMKIKKQFKVEETQLMGHHFQQFGFGILERSLERGMSKANLGLEKYLSILASIASVSPFVGLLGTVWGIINSFTGLASGGATLDKVAPGIAEALVATAVGLFAAIPAVWFYNYFSNHLVGVNAKLNSFSRDFLNSVERSLIGDDVLLNDKDA